MNRSFLVVITVVVIILALVGVYGWQRTTATTAAAAVRAQTVAVTRGTIAATVSAAGNVSTVKSTNLTFQTAGKVAKVNAQVGDAVKAGQLLMQLDLTDLQLALRTAQANLTVTQANYNDAVNKNSQSSNQLVVARTQLEKARIALELAQANYNKVAWRGDVGMTQQAADLQTATIEYQSALANYKMTEATISDITVKTTAANVEKDKIAIEVAQRNLDKASIYAPYDGYIAAVNLNPSDSATTNAAAIVLADLNSLQVKVTVAEVDIAKVKVGQAAQVTFDALSGKTYTATVTTLGPVGAVTQGVVNYPVTLSVINTDGAIKPGMTANLAINIEQRENVLTLPTRAVRSQGNQRTVTVLYKGQQISLPVTTGLTNDTLIEIISGANEGDQVLLQQTQTRTTGGLGVPGAGPILMPGGR